MALSRDDILRATDLPVSSVEVPEWGGTVFVRTLTAEEYDEFERSTFSFDGGKKELHLENVRGRFVALCACDEDGRRLFCDDDAPELGRRSKPAIERVYEAAQRLNGVAAGSVEDAKKN